MKKNIKDNKKIYFLEVLKEDECLVVNSFPNARVFYQSLSEKEIISNCLDAEIICTSIYTKFSKKVINSLRSLRLIVTRSVGYDHIDLETANKRKVIVCNVPNYGSHVISEFVFALLLSGLRYISQKK